MNDKVEGKNMEGSLENNRIRRIINPENVPSRSLQKLKREQLNQEIPNIFESVPISKNTTGATSWIAEIGEGTYGKVHKCLSPNGESIAVKICENTGEGTGITNIKEIDMLVRLNKSPFVVDIKNVCFTNPFTNKSTIIKKDLKTEKVSIFMEHIEESGKNFFKNKNKCTPLVGQKLFAQLIMGKISMDNETIMHRDIKPDNLLIGKKSNGEYFIKICDFGLAQNFSIDAKKTPGVITYPYRGPEVCAELSYNGSVDTWSIGCAAFEIFGTQKLIDNIQGTKQCRKTLAQIICKIPIQPNKEKLELYEEYFTNSQFLNKIDLNDLSKNFIKEEKLFENIKIKYIDLSNLLIEINEDQYKNSGINFLKHNFFNEIRQQKTKLGVPNNTIELEIKKFLALISQEKYDIFPTNYEKYAYNLINNLNTKDTYRRNNCLTTMGMTHDYKRMCRSSGINLDHLEDLITKMLDIDFIDRINAKESLEHPFFDNIRDYINEMFENEEIGEKMIPSNLDILYIYPCIERQWIFKIIDELRDDPPEWFNYRLIFHAIELFDRYLDYAFNNIDSIGINVLENEVIENGEVIKGRLHNYRDTAIRFYSCLYIYYKYYSWVIELSWENFVPEEYATKEGIKLFIDFEIFLFYDLSQCKINRQTLYEVGDKYNIEMTITVINKLLKYYGNKNLKFDGEGSIRSLYRKILNIKI